MKLISSVAVVLTLMGMLQQQLQEAEGAVLSQVIHGSLVRDLIHTAGLMDMLTNDGPFTVFLPSDQNLRYFLYAHNISVASAKQDPSLLRQYLLFHMTNGSLFPQDLYNERMLTGLNGWKFRVNSYQNDAIKTVQGVRLYGQSHTNNGNLYLLAGPMTPVDDNGTIAAMVSLMPDLSSFVNASVVAGLDSFLHDQSPLTLFAPTNAAFNALGDKLANLTANPQLLSEVLKYHVVPGTIFSPGLTMHELPTFEEDDKIHIRSYYGHLEIEGGHIRTRDADIPAINGVIHKIDRVLIPASLREQI